jgi:hypothetical protein
MHAVSLENVGYSSSRRSAQSQVTGRSLCGGPFGVPPGYEWTVKKNDTNVVLETVKRSQHVRFEASVIALTVAYRHVAATVFEMS